MRKCAPCSSRCFGLSFVSYFELNCRKPFHPLRDSQLGKFVLAFIPPINSFFEVNTKDFFKKVKRIVHFVSMLTKSFFFSLMMFISSSLSFEYQLSWLAPIKSLETISNPIILASITILEKVSGVEGKKTSLEYWESLRKNFS